MTDNFKFIYKILEALEAAMDCPEFDINQISADKFGISKERWGRYLVMMLDAGYITGVTFYSDFTDELCIDNEGIRITLKGLEYLSENTIMQRMYETAMGIKDMIK